MAPSLKYVYKSGIMDKKEYNIGIKIGSESRILILFCFGGLYGAFFILD